MRVHTPGPWKIRAVSPDHDWQAVYAEGNCITGALSSGDARLIAAAPDMLATLHAIVESMESSDDKTARIQLELLDKACAVIAKARGEV